MTSKMMQSYAEGRNGAVEYSTQDTKGAAYSTLGTGEPDYTWEIGGTAGYAVGESDASTFLEQKMNGEYATGESDASTFLEQKMNGEYATGVESVDQAEYAIQSNNGEYATGKDEVVALTNGGYAVVKKDEEDYIKQDSNGPYTVASIGHPDYALGSAVQGYATGSTGPIYSEGSSLGSTYSTSGFTSDNYVNGS